MAATQRAMAMGRRLPGSPLAVTLWTRHFARNVVGVGDDRRLANLLASLGVDEAALDLALLAGAITFGLSHDVPFYMLGSDELERGR